MRIDVYRLVPASIVVTLGVLLVTGCGRSGNQNFTRIHVANSCGAAVIYLAIEDSEMAAKEASNRLASPLMPHAIYSAVLSRPGNYWVRTETESGGSTIQRLEGPIRVERGVHTWELKREDEMPLYRAASEGQTLALSVVSARR